MPKIYTLLFLFIALGSYAQDKASIRHYQKKWKTDSIHLPCQKWDSRDLLIHLPDSVYGSGEIQIKKLKYRGVSGFNYSLTIKNSTVQSVEIKCKGKKRESLLLELDYHINESNKMKNVNICKVVPFLNSSRSRSKLLLKIAK